MIKSILVSAVLLFPTFASADSCFPVFEKEEREINERDGYKTHLPGQLYRGLGGQIGYLPGPEMTVVDENWAEDFIEAVKWGPNTYLFGSTPDKRLPWLKGFRDAVKQDCDLPEGDYEELRSILKELMEDGSFCPENKILPKGKWERRRTAYIKVLEDAVGSGRFSEYCKSKAVKDDSFRDVKDVSSRDEKSKKKTSASEQ